MGSGSVNFLKEDGVIGAAICPINTPLLTLL